MGVVPVGMSVNHTFVQCPQRPERPEGSFRSPETGVTDGVSHHVGAGNQA